jgi:hypothetical protein
MDLLPDEESEEIEAEGIEAEGIDGEGIDGEESEGMKALLAADPKSLPPGA